MESQQIDRLTEMTVAFMVPFLPYLLESAEKRVAELEKRFEKNQWDKAVMLWSRFQQDPQVVEVAAAVAEDPDDAEAHAAFRRQIRLTFGGSYELAEEARQLFAEIG